MLVGLEIDGMPPIFPLFEDMDDGGRTPAVNVLDRLGSVHTLVKSRQMYRWNFNLVLGQPGGDLIGAVASQRHGEDTPHHSSGILVYQPMLPLFIPQPTFIRLKSRAESRPAKFTDKEYSITIQ